MAKRTIGLILSLILIVGSILFMFQYFHRGETIRISTTTSLYATGLLDLLADEFKHVEGGVILQFIPVGSGAALELAARGDVDMVFVHAPNLELKYINSGVLVNGSIIAYNYFVLVGPSHDPAQIRNLTPIDAMKKIYYAGEEGLIKFVSRGDRSGTHLRELLLWKLAGLNASGKSWYIETGSGMSETLLVANEYNAYTISDIGTFLKLKKEGRLPNLEILVNKGRILINIYSVYIVNPKKFPHVKYGLAIKFLKFVVSDFGQELIAKYGVDKYGQPLFYPAKGKEEELRDAWRWLANFSIIFFSNFDI